MWALKLLMAAASIVALIHFNKLSLPLKLVGVQLTFAIVLEVCATLITKNPSITNYPLFNFYMLAEMLMLGMAAILFQSNKGLRIFFLLCVLSCFAFWLQVVYDNGNWAYFRFDRKYSKFTTTSFLVNCIFLAFAYLVLLLQLFFSSASEKPFQKPLFWICIAHVVYFGCDIPLFSLLQSLLTQNKTMLIKRLYNINQVLTAVRYGLVIYAMILSAQQYNRKQTS